MLQFAKKLLVTLLLVAGVTQAKAFSLIGPFETWMTTDLGYQLLNDAGGPMNLGDEYRFGAPTIVYAYDPTFLNYFGQDGVDAVESAIKMLNDLPEFSKMSADLREFPMDTRRFNFRAAALGVRDLKSWALAFVLESLGLTTPERYVFTLRSRIEISPDLSLFRTIMRNFDPVTFEPTSYINGTLYSYRVAQTQPDPVFEAVAFPVDPLAPSVTTVAGFTILAGEGTVDARGRGTLFNPGLFYSGLTRDDVGGLRYLYRRQNMNVENVAPNSTTSITSGGSTIGTTPWVPVGGGLGGGQAGGGQAGGGIGGQPGGGIGGQATTNLVDLALRPGPDKIRLVRARFDSQLGVFTTNTVIFTDVFVTNNVLRQQVLQRTVTVPDILFSAADLDVNAAGDPIVITRDVTFQNNSAQNSLSGNTIAGPGIIVIPVEISFSKVGPNFRNVGFGGEENATRGIVWGSFDASTNAPVVFPAGFSLQELENIVLKKGGVSPWRVIQ